MPKLEDLAKEAGVSLATASLAMNDDPRINKKTREKIKKLAKKIKYIPNWAAQRLASGKNYNICIMLNSNFFKSSNIYYLKTIGGIIGESEKTKYSISFSFYSEKNKDTFLENNAPRNIDGIIVFDVISKNNLSKLKEEFNVPIVLMDNHKKHREMNSVDNDDFGGAYKATNYLIKLGYKEIGYIGIPDSHPLGNQCWRGFKRALKENKLEEIITYKNCGIGINSGKKAIKEILRRKIPINTGFFCVNDYIAIGVIEGLKNRGFKIPDHFSIIAMDDQELSGEIEPPLTTVRINMEELGRCSLNYIMKLINNDYNGKTKIVIDNQIIVRKSTRKIS